MNKKILIFVFTILFTSLVIPFSSVFATPEDDLTKINNHYETLKTKINKYGVRKFNKEDYIYSRDTSQAKATDQKIYWDVALYMGSAICSKKYAKPYDREYWDKACESFQNKKYPAFLNIIKSETFATASFVFYTGSKENEPIFRHYFKAGYYNGFASQSLPVRVLERDFTEIYAHIHFTYDKDSRFHLSQNVDMSSSNFYTKLNDDQNNKVFLMGQNKYQFINIFNDFKVEYPNDFPLSDKTSNDNPALNNKPDYYPYFAYKVNDMNLNGEIINVNSDKKMALDPLMYMPNYELYKEDKTTKIFEYHGDNLYDKFNYDFEQKGYYWVKTYVNAKPPLKNTIDEDWIHQPVYAKIKIGSGDYTFFPNDKKYCDQENCEVPVYAESCVATHEKLGEAVGCEIQNLDFFFSQKLGILYFPINALKHVVGVYSNNTITCHIKISQYDMNACYIQEKTPQIYSLLNMFANGALICCLILWLRHELYAILSGNGEE